MRRLPTVLHPLLSLWLPRRPAGAALLAGCVVSSMACAASVTAPVPNAVTLNLAGAANQWPRLFYTPTQRSALVRARYADPATPSAPEAVGGTTEPLPPTIFVLQGMAQGSQGASVWINGQMLRNGALLDGRTVHIEQQAVRLRQSGQPDLVLKPGQTSLEPGQPVVDVVPSGTFIKR